MTDRAPVPMPVFQAFLADHTPRNKQEHEVINSRGGVKVQDYDGTGPTPDAWTEIMLFETYTPADGTREVSRTISVTIGPKERAELIAMLTRAPSAPAAG